MKKLLLLLGFLLITSQIFSQWSTDPNINNQVTTASGDQQNVATCPDGAGGIIMTWMDGNTAKIYAQKINAFGQPMWGASGIVVSPSPGNQSMPCITSDAAGGAIIGWRDGRHGDYSIYAQRVRTDGVIMWDPWGVRVTTGVYDQMFHLKCIGAEAGYAIFGWLQYFSGTSPNGLYAQKLDAFGAKLWDPNDLRLSYDVTTSLDICRDGMKGAYFSYSMLNPDDPGSSNDIYAQHVSAMGDTLWNIHHIINYAPSIQNGTSMCEDQDFGFIVSWWDYRSGVTDVYAARVDSNGVNQWTPNGTPICTLADDQLYPYCISDAHGGAHIVWIDFRPQPVAGCGVYGQNINHAGQIQWTLDGKRIAHRVDFIPTQDLRINPQVASVDALGGLIACWIGYNEDALTNYGVLVQKIDYYGNTQWNSDGVFVTTGALKKGPSLIFDGGSGGCNIAWADGRTFGASGYDVYAQHVKSNANLGNRPNSNQNGSKTAAIKQNYPNPFNPVTNISFDISQTGFVSLKIYDLTGREVAVLADGTYEPGEYSVTWNAANFATGAYLYKFTANGNTEIKTMMLIK